MQNWQENIPMTKDKFWEVIDNARAIAPALEGEPLRESLYKQLLTLSPDELVGFDCAWQEYRRIANSPQLIAAACIINGPIRLFQKLADFARRVCLSAGAERP